MRNYPEFDKKFIKVLAKRVEAGAKWLTKNDGDWVKNTKLDELDLQDSESCMLGQAFGNFWGKVNESIYFRESGKMSKAMAGKLGFYLTIKELQKYRIVAWDVLTDLWTDKIKKMRAARKARAKKAK